MMNWKKEKPLIGTEGLIKLSYFIFSTNNRPPQGQDFNDILRGEA